MNGYFALYEVDTVAVQTFGGPRPGDQIGTVHAAEPDAADGAPGDETLCGLDTKDLRRVPLDIPADPFDTWYPPGGHVRRVCQVCDRLAATTDLLG
ncbi:hypothetical protein [Streptomyces sp. NPDC045470]|uniref:hypothetical protein n=1 Tax=Streptomyces sp. NPDC045470 TaxID=3155469 RepID=UPI003405542D